MRKHLGVLLGAAMAVPALAAPIDYTVTFTVESVFGAGAPSGSFTYDPSAGFSNFVVHWESATFEATSSANAPLLASEPATGCNAAGSNHEYGFLLMTQSVSGCAAAYVWSGLYYGQVDETSGYSQLFFILGAGNAQDEIAADSFFAADPSIPMDIATGTWRVSAAGVPEPGTLGVMLLAGLGIAGMSARRRG